MKPDQFTGKKSRFLNLSQDGIKIRSNQFKNKKKYDRHDNSWRNKENWDE